jgi:hypothetical protein
MHGQSKRLPMVGFCILYSLRLSTIILVWLFLVYIDRTANGQLTLGFPFGELFLGLWQASSGNRFHELSF